MSEWEEINRGKSFISDLGEARAVTMEGNECHLGRYAAWMPTGEDKHQVVEVSDSIEQLMVKYKVPQERIYVVSPA